jgi:DNA invertase Pin-like site-specific DNA recombinase
MLSMKIGYARVSTTGQSLESQIAALHAEGCEEIFQEKLSGKSADTRHQLQAALLMCRKGDVLIATKVDRLARSMTDLWTIVSKLEEKKAALKILDQPLIDTTRPEGKVVVTLFSYVAETERQLILERTAQGRERAKAKGVQFGRKATLTEKQLEAMKVEASSWQGSMTDLGKKYGVSRSSVYRLLGANPD